VGAPRRRLAPQLSPTLSSPLPTPHSSFHYVLLFTSVLCIPSMSCSSLFFLPRVEEEMASTTRDESGNSGSTAEQQGGPCSSSRSLSKVICCSFFFYFALGGGGGCNALETMGTAHHLHTLILPSISPLSLSTDEMIAQAHPHRSARHPAPPRASLL
jgi:hypothetical protein